jgi:hypothetical protein
MGNLARVTDHKGVYRAHSPGGASGGGRKVAVDMEETSFLLKRRFGTLCLDRRLTLS